MAGFDDSLMNLYRECLIKENCDDGGYGLKCRAMPKVVVQDWQLHLPLKRPPCSNLDFNTFSLYFRDMATGWICKEQVGDEKSSV
jgi:hypothetical protein